MWKQIVSSFLNKITYKLFTYKLYIYTYIKEPNGSDEIYQRFTFPDHQGDITIFFFRQYVGF